MGDVVGTARALLIIVTEDAAAVENGHALALLPNLRSKDLHKRVEAGKKREKAIGHALNANSSTLDFALSAICATKTSPCRTSSSLQRLLGSRKILLALQALGGKKSKSKKSKRRLKGMCKSPSHL